MAGVALKLRNIAYRAVRTTRPDSWHDLENNSP